MYSWGFSSEKWVQVSTRRQVTGTVTYVRLIFIVAPNSEHSEGTWPAGQTETLWCIHTTEYAAATLSTVSLLDVMLSTRSRQKRGVPGDSVLTGFKDRSQDSGCPLGGVTGQGGREGGFWKLEMSLDPGARYM